MEKHKTLGEWMIENYSKKVWEKFKKNVKEGDMIKNIKELEKKSIQYYWIDEAFYWKDTEEGYRFWWNIEIKWHRYIDAHYEIFAPV